MSKPKVSGQRKSEVAKRGPRSGPVRQNVQHNSYALNVDQDPTNWQYRFHVYRTLKIAKATAISLIRHGKATTVEVVSSNTQSKHPVSVFTSDSVNLWPKYSPVRTVTRHPARV